MHVEGLVCENTSSNGHVGVSMETPPFTMTSFQSAHGQVAVWCKYSSSETDDRIARSNIRGPGVLGSSLSEGTGRHVLNGGGIESVECSTEMEWWNGIVEWPHLAILREMKLP